MCAHSVSIRHARHPFGIDKRDGLHLFKSRIGQRLDEFHFVCSGIRPRLDLKAFTRSLFVDMDGLGVVAHDVYCKLCSPSFGAPEEMGGLTPSKDNGKPVREKSSPGTACRIDKAWT